MANLWFDFFLTFQVGLSENNSKQVQFVVHPKHKVKTEGEIVSTIFKKIIPVIKFIKLLCTWAFVFYRFKKVTVLCLKVSKAQGNIFTQVHLIR